jgi:hypothetical protein
MDTPAKMLTPENVEAFAQGPDKPLSDVDRLTAGLKHLEKQTKIANLLCIVQPEGGIPILIGSGKDVTKSYALVEIAADGLRHAVMQELIGQPSGIEEVSNG